MSKQGEYQPNFYESPEASRPQALQNAYLGSTALGGNTVANRELFEWRQGSVSRLIQTLPKLPAGQETHFSRTDITSETDPDGTHRGVIGVVLAGDTAVAIVASMNQNAHNAPFIKFVELPYGEHAANHAQTGRQLAAIDPSVLTQPRADGVVQNWETLTFGRLHEGGVRQIGEDRELSRKHFSATVTPDGMVSVRDEGSTNGTVLITDTVLAQQRDNPQLQALHAHLLDPAANLEWNSTYTEHLQVPQP